MPTTVADIRRLEQTRVKQTRVKQIGIPLEEVGDRLKALNESLLKNGMALKADTGVHIDCSRDKVALSLVLEVYLFEEEEEKEEENGKM